jgi:DNA (cytosine-5)-methyltransferase 1
MSGKPIVISTFAGCGGSSLGYKWAGFEELLAIEWDKNAVETFKLNFPKVPAWQRDIATVTGQEILDFTGLKKGQLDIFDGSPPCQGFSVAKGKRNVTDQRNNLSFEYIRLINEIQPKVFVMENVPGMMRGKMKGRFVEIMRALKDTGYSVKCKLMNSMYYEVPQSRQRLIFIGVKNGVPKFPEPINNIISIKDAIKRDGYIEYRHSYSKGNVNFKKSFFCDVCLTITKNHMGWNVQPVPFSIDEIKILSSFPEDFKFIGSFNQKWARIGNSVMPKFMYHIANNIKTKII